MKTYQEFITEMLDSVPLPFTKSVAPKKVVYKFGTGIDRRQMDFIRHSDTDPYEVFFTAYGLMGDERMRPTKATEPHVVLATAIEIINDAMKQPDTTGIKFSASTKALDDMYKVMFRRLKSKYSHYSLSISGHADMPIFSVMKP